MVKLYSVFSVGRLKYDRKYLPLVLRKAVYRVGPLIDNVDLGELMFSLCYLPTAGRLTITIIKARNLKAMDITGASDPYVKVSLMCDGRRLKKRKTSTKRNTLNPVYNEAIVFDVPPESIDQIHLSIAVMDYDRVGHNEVIGVCHVGNEAERLGRDHWSEMLSYPRKPIAHWHSLMEVRPAATCSTLWIKCCAAVNSMNVPGSSITSTVPGDISQDYWDLHKI
ncbi:Synaptotagmin-9 [Cricetulus griseus]|uniref:Synaptotagmin-9 n=1 Tax=Cricetulus griseus TaxID=10029 RepID=G3IFF8_CRIGR|nr:Synaptotagmin-9 [Cricetulus griseus]